MDDKSNKKRSSEGDGQKKEGKSKKKKAKLKHAKDAAVDESHVSPLESTATPQGQIMAQVLSTFNRLEQSRFEAFRRSTFSTDAVSKYVAHCLIDRNQYDADLQPILSHVCAPGQANEIAMIVSALSKIYAQRLVHDSRQFAEPNQPVQPSHMLRAFEERRARGLDPGLFLQPARAATVVVSGNDSFNQRRMAALRLQEKYDDKHGSDTAIDDGDSGAQTSQFGNDVGEMDTAG
eukprot:scaffold3079_cov119-Cylindrotheca_fusiformis.AAC.20